MIFYVLCLKEKAMENENKDLWIKEWKRHKESMAKAQEGPGEPKNSLKWHDSHYAGMEGLQPIEIMQMTMTKQQFEGFLIGNIVKYTMRAGNKAGEPKEKDLAKAKRYKEWLDQALKGAIIDPRV